MQSLELRFLGQKSVNIMIRLIANLYSDVKEKRLLVLILTLFSLDLGGVLIISELLSN